MICTPEPFTVAELPLLGIAQRCTGYDARSELPIGISRSLHQMIDRVILGADV